MLGVHKPNKAKKEKKKKRKTVVPTIVVDEEIILQEILPHLRTKSLCRFKSVCKNWLNLITNDHVFFTNHSRKFTPPPPPLPPSSHTKLQLFSISSDGPDPHS
ncbi:hypothetical protein Sjap_017255 [Stephania japonica]|uniref:F-box domain-containing protein n=1 Tax=Stephania japonica TaxID=461633 RepID=A0AAP0NK54_9MAGN